MSSLTTAWRMEQIAVRSPHPPATALRLVRESIDARHPWRRRAQTSQADFVITGIADHRGVRISAVRPTTQNSWRTLLRARIVPDGSGSVLEGSLGWYPMIRAVTVTLTLGMIAAWAFVGGAAIRALSLGHPVLPALAAIGAVTVVIAVWTGLVAIGERWSRAETAHLRAWIGERLTAPAPPAAPAPKPRPAVRIGAPARIRPAVPSA